MEARDALSRDQREEQRTSTQWSAGVVSVRLLITRKPKPLQWAMLQSICTFLFVRGSVSGRCPIVSDFTKSSDLLSSQSVQEQAHASSMHSLTDFLSVSFLRSANTKQSEQLQRVTTANQWSAVLFFNRPGNAGASLWFREGNRETGRREGLEWYGVECARFNFGRLLKECCAEADYSR